MRLDRPKLTSSVIPFQVTNKVCIPLDGEVRFKADFNKSDSTQRDSVRCDSNRCDLDYEHPYVQSRGLSVDLAKDMGIGVCNKTRDRLLISLCDQRGQHVNYVPRYLDNRNPKYDFTNISKNNYLYNYHKARAIKNRSVVVVEGFFGCSAVRKVGCSSVIALMGSHMSETQELLLTRWWERIVLMLDGDQTGQQAQQEIKKRLTNRGFVEVYEVKLPSPEKTNSKQFQPDHFDTTELRQFLLNPTI